MKKTGVVILVLCFVACLRLGTNQPDAGVETDLDAGMRVRPASSRHIDAGQPGPGTFRFTISGERFAREGYPFPPAALGEPAFVDGWELHFDYLLVSVDKISLWETPDLSETDPMQVGTKVAEATGPWIVDLHRGPLDAGTPDAGETDAGERDGGDDTDAGELDAGEEGDGGMPDAGPGSGDPLAVTITLLFDQNLLSHRPFDPTKRYAVSFELARPVAGSQLINLVPQAETEYQTMRQNGYVIYYIGTAVWRGTSDTCTSTDGQFDFSRTPTTIRSFRLGFKTPTRYLNCQNPDLPGPGIGSEPHPRGVIPSSETETTVQLTLRTDQLFWENYDAADAPLHFDQFAVAAHRDLLGYSLPAAELPVGDGGILRQNYTMFAIPWRSCSRDLTGYSPPDREARMGFQHRLYYDPNLTQPLSSSTSFRDYYDLASHIQSGQGYLGARGVCAVQRQFPSRP